MVVSKNSEDLDIVRGNLELCAKRASLSFAFLALMSSPLSWAQKTVVQDAGAGQKQELVYDAAGQIVETRIIGADGALKQKNLFEFEPKAVLRQQTVISYWPDGKSAHSRSHESYDENRNFTQEIIEVFDQTGAHTGGHKMTHDPFTNVFECSRWEKAAQQYQAVECPAAEESGTPPPPQAPLSYAQAEQLQAEARQTALAQEKSARMQRKSPIHPADSAAEVAVVLPARLYAGEHVSGSVVEDAAAYDGMPDLLVVRMALPSNGTDEPLALTNWTFEVAGEGLQNAGQAVRFQVPTTGVEFKISLQDRANPERTVSHGVPIMKGAAAVSTSTSKSGAGSGFAATPLCIVGSVCVIGGRLDGDSSPLFASFDDVPARIIAASREFAYIAVPAALRLGPQHLIMGQGAKLTVFPVCIGELSIETDKTALAQQESVMGTITLEHVGDLPEARWRDGVFPPANLRWAQSLMPGFDLQAESQEAREKRGQSGVDKDKEEEEASGGMVLVVLRNMTPESAVLRGAGGGPIAFRLTHDSFKAGDFTYRFSVEGLKPGPFRLKAIAVPLLAPIAGQELKNATEANGAAR